MRNGDAEAFWKLLDATQEGINNREPLSADAKLLMFEDLAEYSFETVKQAMRAHRKDPQRGQWSISVAHIEHQIQRRMPVQWLAADEAFARITFDDSQPALLNQVTAAALAVAAPFMEQQRPDHNAARMAFRACYDRLVAVEKLAGQLPQYFISGGGSAEARQAVQDEAARLGYLNVAGLPFAPAQAAPQLGYSKAPAAALEQLRGFGVKAVPLDEGDRKA
ncbi:MAG: hypothetical protein V4641_16250 [Pseudomonadota bacterium]